ncbi:hypothetical protein APC39_15595 [Acinetobacter pittii]|uniref:hypothetical protein n=1 Tax=Acinetobacter pittii TaxID=48296 RepID=UPI0007078BC5|nr:hypothetical protein [Acinetobacter pittii]KQG37007.1 hypothetical protein APC39_15595 [Acinetobacter pittii]
MDNYKIKVKDEAESKEAQELFDNLGFKWAGDHPENGDWYSHLYAENSTCCYLSPYVWGGLGDRFKELTLPQLRDLVVLKRNDVKDANVEDGTGFPLYLSSTNELYVNDCEWKLSKKNGDLDYICKLKLIHRPQDPALISGRDAWLTSFDGEHVQYRVRSSNDEWDSFNPQDWLIEDLKSNAYEFRLKPQTIKLELELPKPFEPKEGDECFIFDSEQEDGFYHFVYRENSGFHQNLIQYGAYRTEEEIKQVVEQLRKIRGTNS